MPKQKASKSKVLRAYVSEFGETILSTDGAVLNCIPCEKVLNADTRFQVVQHLETGKHKKCVERKNSKGQQLFLAGSLGKQGKLSPFSLDLCIAFTAADIPLYKLENPQLRSFFSKYLRPSDSIPHDSTLRKTYLSIWYHSTMNLIQEKVAGHKVWISIDETVDVKGRQVANVIVGIFLIDGLGKQYLLTTEILEKTNHSTIGRLFTESIKLLGKKRITSFFF